MKQQATEIIPGNDLLNSIVSAAVVKRAWAKVESKGSAGGIDKVNIAEYKQTLTTRLESLRERVLAGKYVPEPYQVFFIEKKSGAFRPLAMLPLDDKILQNCVWLVFEESIEKKFVNTSYAYRQQKGHKKVIGRISDYLQRKYNYILPLDIKSYFDTIDRQLLMEYCKEFFPQPEVQQLLAMWVLTGGVYHGKYISAKTGIAQGGVLSPVLSNIYLTGYDREMEKHKFENVRYCDNILLMAKTEQQLKESIEFTYSYLKTTLRLELNTRDPLPLQAAEGFDFCGLRFYDGKRLITNDKFTSIIKKLEALIASAARETFITTLTQHRDGILRYYNGYDTEAQLQHLDTIMLQFCEQRINKMLNRRQVETPKEAGSLMRQIPLFTEVYRQELMQRAATAFRRTYNSEGTPADRNRQHKETGEATGAERLTGLNRLNSSTEAENYSESSNEKATKATTEGRHNRTVAKK